MRVFKLYNGKQKIPKDVIEPLNEFGREAPKDLRGFFYLLKFTKWKIG